MDSATKYADDWHRSDATVVAIINVKAPSDSSGNPRRAYVGMDARGHVVAVQDEGYAGMRTWAREAYNAGMYALPVNVSAVEYARFIRLIEQNRGRFALKTDANAADPNVAPYCRGWTRNRVRKMWRDLYPWVEDAVIVDSCADA